MLFFAVQWTTNGQQRDFSPPDSSRLLFRSDSDRPPSSPRRNLAGPTSKICKNQRSIGWIFPAMDILWTINHSPDIKKLILNIFFDKTPDSKSLVVVCRRLP